FVSVLAAGGGINQCFKLQISNYQLQISNESCHPESRANARAKDPDAPSCSRAASGNFHQHVRTSVKLETITSVILSRGRTPERRTPTLPHAPMPPQGIFTDP